MTQTTKEFPARVKVGANQHALVYVQQYCPNAQKFLIQWPSSPAAVGYFREDELHPESGWHFGPDNTLLAGDAPRPSFANGDPMQQVKPGEFSAEPVLVELKSGVVTLARPIAGFLCQGRLYSHQVYRQDWLVLCDPHAEFPERVDAQGCILIRLSDVVAWQPLPRTLRA